MMNENELNYTYKSVENRYDFHTIPLSKFFLMSWVTFGLWYLRWNYRMWQAVAVDYNYNVSPFWRSAFTVIFNFPLFKIIEKHSDSHGLKFAISSTWLAVIFILFCFLPSINNIVVDIITAILLVSPAAYVQHKINEVNKKSYPDAFVEKWNIADTIWTAIGIILRIALGIIGKKFDR